MSESLYVWHVMNDGEWGTIATAFGDLPGLTPLVTRREVVADGPFRVLAELHHAASQHPVRLARFDLAEVEVTL